MVNKRKLVVNLKRKKEKKSGVIKVNLKRPLNNIAYNFFRKQLHLERYDIIRYFSSSKGQFQSFSSISRKTSRYDPPISTHFVRIDRSRQALDFF